MVWLAAVMAAACAVCAAESRGDREFLEGRYLDALASYRTELRVAAGGRERARVQTNLALLYVQLGEYGRALETFREVLGGGDLTEAERGRVLSGLGDLYRRMGQEGDARDAYREARQAFAAAGARAEEIGAVENAGAAGGGESDFAEAVNLAEAGGDRAEAARAHLFLGEWKLRAGDLAGAEREFAAGSGWRGSFGAARVARRRGEREHALELVRKAVQALDAAPAEAAESGYLPRPRAVYDAALGMLLEDGDRDAAEWFGLMERAHASSLRDLLRGEGVPKLDAVRRRLAEGDGLVEYWSGEDRRAAVWATREGAGVTDGAEIPWEKMGRAWVVPDRGVWRTGIEADLAVSYLPSAALLFREHERRGSLAPWRRQAAVFGGDARAVLSGLPGRVAVYSGGGVKRWAAESAREGVPLLYFAAPAVEDAVDGNRSRIVFAPGEEAGACLFRGEVVRLPLDGVDLVTLAKVEGEGQSLSLAFLAAGARAVVAPLWPVDDAARADFLREFYANVGRGMAPAEALHAVRVEWRRSGGARAERRAWGAYVVIGDGEDAVREVTPWWTVGLVAFGAGAALGVWVWRRRRRGRRGRPAPRG